MLKFFPAARLASAFTADSSFILCCVPSLTILSVTVRKTEVGAAKPKSVKIQWKRLIKIEWENVVLKTLHNSKEVYRLIAICLIVVFHLKCWNGVQRKGQSPGRRKGGGWEAGATVLWQLWACLAPHCLLSGSTCEGTSPNKLLYPSCWDRSGPE